MSSFNNVDLNSKYQVSWNTTRNLHPMSCPQPNPLYDMACPITVIKWASKSKIMFDPLFLPDVTCKSIVKKNCDNTVMYRNSNGKPSNKCNGHGYNNT